MRHRQSHAMPCHERGGAAGVAYYSTEIPGRLRLAGPSAASCSMMRRSELEVSEDGAYGMASSICCSLLKQALCIDWQSSVLVQKRLC